MKMRSPTASGAPYETSSVVTFSFHSKHIKNGFRESEQSNHHVNYKRPVKGTGFCGMKFEWQKALTK
jgi:hypothetical protein